MALNTELLLTLKQIKGLGNKTILSIAKAIDASSIESLCSKWIFNGNKRLEQITQDDLLIANSIARRIIRNSEEEGIGLISYFDKEFPPYLKECVNEKGTPAPPLVLFYRGNLQALNLPAIAVIGTREPTPNGIQAGRYFAGEFAKAGFNIVSGLAVGCDTSGHEGALNVRGITTAFLATSLEWNAIYPKQNQDLARKIVENDGLLLSEYYIGQPTSRFCFVERDRLQAGLSCATVVVQTGLAGGTFHAVNATLKSRKPLMMVKYNLEKDYDHDKAAGNKLYIQNKQAIPLNTQSFVTCLGTVNDYIKSKKSSIASHSLFD